MKVSVITRHAITNYGSLLQALATQIVLERMGHQCETVNYIRDDEAYGKYEFTILKRKPTWNSGFLKRLFYIALRQPESILAGKRFEKERERLLKQSTLYTDAETLRRSPPPADVYMTGSDQVWGPMVDGSFDSTYCLSFAPGDKRKIAYAASFGHTDLTEDNIAEFRKWLSDYSGIAVREDSAVEILSSMGLQTEQVVDPTLLLSAEEWEPYCGKKIPGKYVLAYQLHNDPKLGRYARKVAKQKGLPLIRISPSFHQILRPGKFVWCPGTAEFLSYLRDADCIITDSFHGTAFAVDFNVPFVEVLPNNATGTRNMSILKMTGLSERILRDPEDTALADAPIDFASVNRIIAEKRAESLAILEKMLK